MPGSRPKYPDLGVHGQTADCQVTCLSNRRLPTFLDSLAATRMLDCIKD
jgi:hypothetical protein